MSGRAGVLYGNLTRDTVLAFLIQMCILVQQTKSYYKVSLPVLNKPDLGGVFWLPCLATSLSTQKMAEFYCASVVPRLVNKLYSKI